jgi:hypothetical protein
MQHRMSPAVQHLAGANSIGVSISGGSPKSANHPGLGTGKLPRLFASLYSHVDAARSWRAVRVKHSARLCHWRPARNQKPFLRDGACIDECQYAQPEQREQAADINVSRSAARSAGWRLRRTREPAPPGK